MGKELNISKNEHPLDWREYYWTGSYQAKDAKEIFHADSILVENAVIYEGARFRPNMLLMMGEKTFIGTNAVILVPKLIMETGSQINAGAILTGKDGVFLGSYSVISYGATLITSSDTPEGALMSDASPEKDRKIRRGPIYVAMNSFIGANAIIMPGVTIGPNSVVGAGSYIDENVPPNVIIYPKQTLREVLR